jgi:hypothetical protein
MSNDNDAPKATIQQTVGFLVNLGLLCSRTERNTGGLHASVHGARNEVAQNERGVDPHS